MPTSFATRLLHSTTSLLTASCLLVAGLVGCDAEPSRDPIVDRASDDELRNTELLVEALAEDPRFVELTMSAVLVAQQQLEGLAQLAPEDRDPYAQRLADPSLFEEVEPALFLDYVGINQAQVDEQLALSQALIADYGLGQLAPAELEELFMVAASTEAIDTMITGMIEYELNPIDEVPPEEDECHTLCDTQYLLKVAGAIQAYIAALAGAAASGPAALIAVAVASAAYIWALIQAGETLDNCRAVCDGEASSDDQCVRDSDCGPDAWCDTGTLGIGANECKPLKPLEKTCSRDTQCASDCCKYHGWTNLVSKVCRPTSKC